MKLHSFVRLREDLPAYGLRRGMAGAIVSVHEAPRRAYEVEFADSDGRTIAELALDEDQLEEVPRRAS